MRIFSDFDIFEAPPKPGFGLMRWMAWRSLLLGTLFLSFLVFFYATYVAGGEPLYFTNEKRYMTRSETLEVFWHFLFVSGPFFVLGLLDVIMVPKR